MITFNYPLHSPIASIWSGIIFIKKVIYYFVHVGGYVRVKKYLFLSYISLPKLWMNFLQTSIGPKTLSLINTKNKRLKCESIHRSVCRDHHWKMKTKIPAHISTTVNHIAISAEWMNAGRIKHLLTASFNSTIFFATTKIFLWRKFEKIKVMVHQLFASKFIAVIIVETKNLIIFRS